jgi:dual specificity protein kinase YAK1
LYSLVPGTSEYNQLSRIIDTLGLVFTLLPSPFSLKSEHLLTFCYPLLSYSMPPNHLLEHGKQVGEYFNSGPAPDGYGGGRGGRAFRLKPMDQYSREHNVQEQPSKQYFKTTSLPEMIKTYAPLKKGAKQSEIDKGSSTCFSSFSDGVSTE